MPARIVQPKSTIGHLVGSPAIREGAGVSLGEAARIMRDANISSLLVGSDSRIVTERDLTRALAAGMGPGEPVAAVASHPVRVPADTPIVDAAAVMLNQEVRHLVVDFDGEEGIVSLRAVLAVLLDAVTPRMWLESLRIAVSTPSATWPG